MCEDIDEKDLEDKGWTEEEINVIRQSIGEGGIRTEKPTQRRNATTAAKRDISHSNAQKNPSKEAKVRRGRANEEKERVPKEMGSQRNEARARRQEQARTE